jgi:tetrahydromethanopterin S-methyltransferase subunit H
MKMLQKFRREQKIFRIGDVEVGGQPGELPTVLIGSIFHEGHRVVKDRKAGVFDRERAEALIKAQEEFSDRTGSPCMVDVVAETSEVLVKYIDFVSELTDAPFLVNGPTAAVRVAAARHVMEVGLGDRAVYNSINYTASSWELEGLKETGLNAAVVQAFNPRNLRPEGMVSMLKGSSEVEGIIEAAYKAGIEKPLVLTPVLDLPSISLASEGIRLIKEELGLPTGTAPVGVVGRWSQARRLGQSVRSACRASAAALAIASGANFIIYGSLAKAGEIFPACALVDALIAYAARASGLKTRTGRHPLYRLI